MSQRRKKISIVAKAFFSLSAGTGKIHFSTNIQWFLDLVDLQISSILIIKPSFWAQFTGLKISKLCQKRWFWCQSLKWPEFESFKNSKKETTNFLENVSSISWKILSVSWMENESSFECSRGKHSNHLCGLNLNDSKLQNWTIYNGFYADEVENIQNLSDSKLKNV